jgi:hypothetical protein
MYYLDILTLENGMDMLPRNVGKKNNICYATIQKNKNLIHHQCSSVRPERKKFTQKNCVKLQHLYVLVFTHPVSRGEKKVLAELNGRDDSLTLIYS